ncbi:MAG: hypothetical protein KGL39_06610 [Patescibacteria group bacterium]|nr:hypothetical protein [Patescibacteria group bacterium]
MAAFDLTPVVGVVDQGNPQAYGTNQLMRLSPYKHQFVDQVGPRWAELVRMGKVFAASGGVVANAIAPVVDMPTTANIHGLYNGNSVASNICLAIIKVSTYAASGTLGLGRAMIGCVSGGAQSAKPSAGTGVVGPNNLLPTSTNASNAVMGTGTALTTAGAWQVLGGLDTPAAVEIGAGLSADVEGMFIVPPTYVFGLHVLAPLGTTAKFLGTIIWAEYQIIPQ